MSSLTLNQSDSPFDAIRRYDERGNEYWNARELMKLMGYTKWQNFETAINQAIENLELNGDKVGDHLLPVVVTVRGQQKNDYDLTRYACYMIALCCDGRKVEVATAKKYFAVKTRQAEISIPLQPQLPSEIKALNVAKAVDEISSLLGETNPRLAQFLIDHAISDILPSQPQLSGTRLRGVVEIAESLGFSVGMNNRSQLGRFVKARCGALAMKEERLVNGTMRNVYCYPESEPSVEQAIKDYFIH